MDGNDQGSTSRGTDDAGAPTRTSSGDGSDAVTEAAGAAATAPAGDAPVTEVAAGHPDADDGPARDASATERAGTDGPVTQVAAGEGDAAEGAPAEGSRAEGAPPDGAEADGTEADVAAADGGATTAAPPKIFDLPDEPGNGGNGTIVLGGAAAAEGRTTGPNPRIAGPASSTSRLAAPDGEEGAEAPPERGRHFSVSAAAGAWPPPSPLLLAAIPLLIIVLLVVGWAVDTAALSGQVMRNVEVEGRSVGGLGEASLPEVMEEVNAELAARPVSLDTGDEVYETTAGEIGLAVDTEATAEAALDAGRRDSLLTRPFSWLRSFFSPRQVDLEYTVTQAQVILKVVELQGTDIVGAQEPTIRLGPEGWAAVPGTPGEGIDPEQVAADLPEAAEASTSGPIEIDAGQMPIAPQFSDEDAQALAERANTMTADGISLTAGDATVQVPAEQLRSWIGPTTEGGELDLAIQPDVVGPAVAELFADIKTEAADASFDLRGGSPVVVPAQRGVECCTDTSADIVWQALSDGKAEAALEVKVTEPELTTAEAEELGIVQTVGGNNAWRSGAPTTAGPGFTTYHDAGQPRVTNIHRMADLVRGAVILPGETFSINDHVGPRTTEKGFVVAGAINEGKHVDEVGGGVSQFATTMFNAAYFAGLDIPVSQSHTEYFDRYPLGREATMGHPHPDLQIRNNTPYGVLIWTSYTASSLTVTLYSTPYATAEQTGITESMNGACRNVSTTRTRTYPDGTTETDTFRATYRPGDGLTC